MTSKWELVRVYVKDGNRYETNHSSAISFTPGVIEEKLALLKLTSVGSKVAEVGRRINTNIYYVRLFPHEYTILDKG
jgi:hypothetical protein